MESKMETKEAIDAMKDVFGTMVPSQIRVPIKGSTLARELSARVEKLEAAQKKLAALGELGGGPVGMLGCSQHGSSLFEADRLFVAHLDRDAVYHLTIHDLRALFGSGPAY